MKRRSYLQITGAAAVGSSFVGNAAASHTTLDVVSDLGVDNTGKTAIDRDLKPHLDDNTRLEFPDGRYRINQLVLYKLQNFQMVATGDATLVPGDYPTNGEVWIGGGAVRHLTFKGFTIDSRNAGPTIGFSAYDGLVVKDIEKVGAHATHKAGFGFSIWSKDGSGLIENLVARDGDVYTDQVGATAIYAKGKGTLTFRNCKLEGWGDNALYASDAKGPVRVQGGYYANNNISQVRLSSPGSYVRDATIKVDSDRAGDVNMRGVRVCTGPGPVEVNNCDISMLRGVGGGGIVSAFDGGSLNIRNTRVHVEREYTQRGSSGSRTGHGILFDKPSGIDSPGSNTIENTSVTGGGKYGAGIGLRRGDVVIRNSCINQTGKGRDGIVFNGDSSGYSVSDTNICASDSALVRNGASVSTSNLTYDESCPLPSGVSYVQHSASAVDLSNVPIPGASSRLARPVMGTSADNPTAVIYARYDDPGMRDFVTGNLPKLIQDFVSAGALNLEFRFLPANDDEDYLTQNGLGVWDKEPAKYWSFFDYVLSRDNLSYSTWSDASAILKASGVRNYGWIPSLAGNDAYASLVNGDEKRAGQWGLASWSDFPPLIEFEGDIAAPQYAYERGIKSWLQKRL